RPEVAETHITHESQLGAAIEAGDAISVPTGIRLHGNLVSGSPYQRGTPVAPAISLLESGRDEARVGHEPAVLTERMELDCRPDFFGRPKFRKVSVEDRGRIDHVVSD